MKRFFWILTLFSTQVLAGEGMLETCLLQIFRKYFMHQPVLVIVDLTTSHKRFQARLLPNLEKEYDREIISQIMRKRNWTVQIYNTDIFLGLPDRLKFDTLKNCLLFIQEEIMASEELFNQEFERLEKNPLWNPTARNVIAVKANGINQKSETLAKKVIEKLWIMSKAVDNLVMIIKDDVIQFYTWFPYRQPECSQVKQVVHLDTYKKRRFLRKTHLFPNKIEHDLQGCEVIAATDTCIPYVIADEGNPNSFVSGVEFNVIMSLSEQLNFKLKTIRPQNMWTTTVNSSLVGAFKLLVEQKIDLAFSCLMLNRERYVLALALPSYIEDSLTWFIPTPVPRSHTSDIFQSFSVIFWLLMIVVLVVSSFFVIFLMYKEHGFVFGSNSVIDHLMKMIGLSLFVPAEIHTKKFRIRFFIFMFCLYSMHITIAFQASMFARFRKIRYVGDYSSLEEAIDAGLFVYLRPSSKELYNQSDYNLWEKILQPGRFAYLMDFGEAFSEIAYEKKAVALFIKSTGIYMVSLYFTDEYGRPEILWLQNKFSRYPVTSYMPHGHPLYDVFHKQISALVTTGLIRHWKAKAIVNKRINMAPLDAYGNNPLSLGHLGGAFFLLLLFLALSILSFLCEVVVFHFFKKNGLNKKKPKHRHFFPSNITSIKL